MIHSIQQAKSTSNLQEINLTIIKADRPRAGFFSTLQSEKCPINIFISLGNFLKNSLLRIFSFFSYLFTLLTCGYFSKRQNALIIENVWQNISKRINLSDPFHNTLFEVKNGHCLSKKPDHFNKATELFSILGTGGLWYWLRHQNALYKLKKEILNLTYIPFEFLLYIFINQETTTNIANLKKSSLNRVLNRTLSIAGHQHPWNTLLLEQSNRLKQYYQKDSKFFQKLIPGFCQLLELDTNYVKKLVQGEEWEKLILYTFDERIKAYKIKIS